MFSFCLSTVNSDKYSDVEVSTDTKKRFNVSAASGCTGLQGVQQNP